MKKKFWKITAFFMAVALTVTCFNLESLYVHATGNDGSNNDATYVKDRGVKNTEGTSVQYMDNDRPETLAEGQVWTGKRVVDNGDNTFTITFEAIGRKYQDNRNGGVWKDPLKDGSTLTISEAIGPNFELVEGSMSEGVTSNEGVVTWTLPSSNVTSDETGQNVQENKASFTVKCIATNVGHYETNPSNVKFTPDGYNHYYYEWETVKSTTTGNVSWNESGKNGLNAITLSSVIINDKLYNNVEIKGNSGTIIVSREDRNGIVHEYVKKDCTNIKNLDGSGVVSVDMYNYFGETDGNNYIKSYDIILEFKDKDGKIIATYRVKGDKEQVEVDNKGGSNQTFNFNEVITHTNPVLKEEFGTSEELSFDLNNHGWIEIAEKSVVLNKTAEQTDNDARKFTINLTASSTYEEIKNSDPIDVVLLLDTSGSMQGNKINTLNNSVNQFINNLKETSPKSRIAIVSFATAGMVVDRTMGFQDVETYVYKDLTAGTETNMNVGMRRVFLNYYHFLDSNYDGETKDEQYKPDSSRKQVMITFADGDNNQESGYLPSNTFPLPEDFYDYEIFDRVAIAYADRFKQLGVTIYSVGLGDNELPIAQQLTDRGIKVLKRIATASDYPYYSQADNPDQLADIFNDLSHKITVGEDLKNVTITDTITKEFMVTVEEENRLKLEGATVTRNLDGTTTVTWTNQTVHYKGSEDMVGWNGKINVVAKEDFLGGNYVPTNVEATLNFGSVTKYFPKPTVNVGPLPITLEDKEIVVFKGDEINVESYAKELYNTIKFNGLSINNSAFGSIQLTNDDIKLLMDNGTVIKEPYMYMDDGNFGKVVYTLTPAEAKNHVAVNKSKTGENGNKLPVETYELNVEYIPMTIQERKNYLGTISNTLVEPTNTEQLGSQGNGTYKVYVIAGEIDLTKIIDQQYTKTAIVNANQSFVFKISKFDSKDATTPSDIIYQTISFSANQEDISKTVKIKDLYKGYYTIEEVSNWSWKYDKNSDDSNYEANGKTNEKIFIGDMQDEKIFGVESDTKINGKDYSFVAISNFHNVKNSNNIVSDVASAINKFNN